MRGPGVDGGAGAVDGYWLPKAVRAGCISPRTEWDALSFAGGKECGRECHAEAPGAVAARWPRLTAENWGSVLAELSSGRDRAPRGAEYWERLEAALMAAGRRLADPTSSVRTTALDTLSRYTGYSSAMVASVMAAPEMWDMRQLRSAFAIPPTRAAVGSWEPMPGMAGLVRFFPDGMLGGVLRLTRRPLFAERVPPGFVVGYGAGNVPGTALIITLLSLATTLVGDKPPVVVIRNSRREPIFSPLVLTAVEEADPDLLASVALLVWDYSDPDLQRDLLGHADLVIAAAGDDTIDRLAAEIASASSATGPRFHPHGHKVSFSAISREMFEGPPGRLFPADVREGRDLLDVVACLAALDSSFWDQNGCLSSRVHFVETPAPGGAGALEYGERLTRHMRLVAADLPRGAWPRRHLRDTFDGHKALEGGGAAETGLRVLSEYDDDFVVVVDGRPTRGTRVDRSSFAGLVNDCRGRVVVVRPVDDLMEIPRVYLRLLPPGSLQSLSVAVGKPGEASTPRFLDFAAACGERGVTAIRVVGRGAFPKVAYSWDGLLPFDLASRRPAGRFATIEFDDPFASMMEAYRDTRQNRQRAMSDDHGKW